MFYRKSSNNQGIQLEWQILSRDCIIYVISVGLLVLVMWDGLITWYEATIFIVLFVGYLVLLFSGEGITRWYNKMKHLCWNGTEFTEESGELVHSSVLFKYRLCSLSFFFFFYTFLIIYFFFLFFLFLLFPYMKSVLIWYEREIWQEEATGRIKKWNIQICCCCCYSCCQTDNRTNVARHV